MSETISLEFIQRRLESIQNDTADVRRRMGTLIDRCRLIEERVDVQTSEIRSLGKQQAILTERLDTVVNRLTGIETTNAEILMLIKRGAGEAR